VKDDGEGNDDRIFELSHFQDKRIAQGVPISC
jgi:hypothetical protein